MESFSFRAYRVMSLYIIPASSVSLGIRDPGQGNGVRNLSLQGESSPWAGLEAQIKVGNVDIWGKAVLQEHSREGD